MKFPDTEFRIDRNTMNAKVKQLQRIWSKNE